MDTGAGVRGVVPAMTSCQGLRLGIVWALLLLLAPAPAAAKDVCAQSDAALRTDLENGASEIAKAYARTPSKGRDSQLSLNGTGTSPIETACNWTCSTPRLKTPLIKAFGLLQHHCSSTTAPASTRVRTGRKTTNELGLSITDVQYRDAADRIFRSGSTGVGDLMQAPVSIQDASRSGKVLDVINAVEALKGATWTLLRSTSVDNDGEGFDRIVIRIPDAKKPPRFEQWIQIAIKDSTDSFGRNVDFIAVQLTESTAPSKSLEVPVVVFRGFSRRPSGWVPEDNGTGFLSKCYSCHPSGLRPIVPAARLGMSMPRGKAPTISKTDVTEITSVLGVFGPAGFTASQSGPPFGPEDRPGRAEFVAKGCAKGVRDAARRQKIVEQMECAACHNDSHRGILNAATNLGTMHHKVVENDLAPMPPGVTDELKPAEREILFECLKAEYAEILKEWLTSDLLMVP